MDYMQRSGKCPTAAIVFWRYLAVLRGCVVSVFRRVFFGMFYGLLRLFFFVLLADCFYLLFFSRNFLNCS